MKKIIFDIETNGFLPVLDKIHCISIHNLGKGYQMHDADNLSITKGVFELAEADMIAGHNIISFDIPAIQKLYPDIKFKAKVIDTYIWAACTWPDIKSTDFARFNKGMIPASLIGKHKLEAYGYRLGILKGSFHEQTDWETWTPEMSTYCEQDVVVTTALLDKLEGKNTSWEQVELEMKVYKILSRQVDRGVCFNKLAAEELYKDLSTKREKLREEIQNSFPPFWKRKGKLFTPKRDCQKRAGEWVGYVAGAPHQKVELVEFNPASAIHVARLLMRKYDWIPKEFTDAEKPNIEIQYEYDRLGISSATTPTVDDVILKDLEYPEAKPITKFLTLNKRCSQLSEGKQGWLKKISEVDDRIHGVCYQFGTVTGRCSHFGPNLGQVPAVYSPYGKECRSLFVVPKDWKLVGCDADGLEARCMAHYMFKYDGGKMIDVILNGKKSDGTDFHSLNKGYLGFKSRDVAKTYFYGLIYGAGLAKSGLIAMEDDNYKHWKAKDAAKLGGITKALLMDKFPGFKDLTKAVQEAARRGWLKGLDGRKIPIRSLHSALNALFQSAGAVIMKKAMVIQDELIQEKGLVPGKDYDQVLFIHDEFQMEVIDKLNYTTIVGECMEKAIRLAGEHFKFKCPLSGSHDVGNNWSETH